MNETLVNRTRDLGLSTGHADTAEELLDEILDQLEGREREVEDLCKTNTYMDENLKGGDWNLVAGIDNCKADNHYDRMRLICAALTGVSQDTSLSPRDMAASAINVANCVIEILEEEDE